jgi:hypothetical protein
MSDEPDVEGLARRYLDLWQDQMKALASDPEYADLLDRLTGMMGAAWNAGAVGQSGAERHGPWASNPWAPNHWPPNHGAPNHWAAWPAMMMAMMSGGASYGRFNGGANGQANETRTAGDVHPEWARSTKAGAGQPNGADRREAGADGRAVKTGSGTGKTAGAAASASASERGSDDMDELAVRMAALEERLASLESALRGDGGGAKPRASKRRS